MVSRSVNISESMESTAITTELTSSNDFHKLTDKWVFWAHLPHDIDWTLKSFKFISTFTTVEDTIAITETLPSVLIENCMLFIMKEGIMPLWEDKRNCNGGSFSYKIFNKNIHKVWKELTYVLTGCSISKNPAFIRDVTGITVSPKKHFCIVKIWMSNCSHKKTDITQEIAGLKLQDCLFEKHEDKK